MAAFLGRQPGDIVFTSGGTEAANLAVLGTVDLGPVRGGEAVLLCSAVEHPAVLESARAAERAGVDDASVARGRGRRARPRRTGGGAVVARARSWPS